ncbi:MAG TPA: alpha/beta hydrolase [Candidatus Bilamarchaeum sp.]|nr:alpha/beta hydrolase [Candidatus Bilamarchaeum sp.]
MRYLPLILLLVLVFGCTGQAPPAQGAPKPAPPQNEIPPTVVKINDSAPEPPATEPPPPQQTEPPPPSTASTLPSKEVSYESGGWTIYGDLYEAKNKNNPTKAIILAHGLGQDRKAFPPSFIQRLHDDIPDAMIYAIDLSGHGKSTNLRTYQDFDASDFKNMKLNIIDARKPIQQGNPTVKSFYVVGADMGSSAAILAGAQEKTITRIAMISPGMSYNGVDIAPAVDDYAHSLFVCAGSGDTASASAAQTIQGMAGESQSDVKIYQGTSAHGTELFKATEIFSQTLEDDIVNFLK